MAEAPPTSPTRRKKWGWVWYFVLLLVLSAVAVAIIIGYNLRQQLTSDELAAAIGLWDARGPRTYKFEYVVKRGDAKPDVYVVRVSDGRVVYGSLNDIPLPVDKLPTRSMAALLGDIRTFMERDAEPGKPWTYTRARFDENDGHLLWYVRRVMGSRERVEIQVRDFEPEPAPAGKNARP